VSEKNVMFRKAMHISLNKKETAFRGCGKRVNGERKSVPQGLNRLLKKSIRKEAGVSTPA
jgi:hypothetical protein